VEVLRGLDLAVAPGERVALLGHNGSGKSTLLMAAFGLLRPWDGRVWLGSDNVTKLSTGERIRRGMGFVPQVRPVFRDLNVRDNLLLARTAMRAELKATDTLALAVERFPRLGALMQVTAGHLSGGEERMLGLAIALVREPRLLLLDEPSAGLSPVAADELFAILDGLGNDITILMAEQRVSRAIDWAERAVILRSGAVHWDTSAEQLKGMNGAELAGHL
jgi:ABC-type branched-subunit amino acid transport system ATPase component